MTKARYHNLDSVIRQMDAVLSYSPGNTFLKDRQGVILYCNQAMANIAGFDDREKLVGRKDSDFCLSQRSLDIVLNNDSLVLQTRKTLRCSELAELPCGNILTFQVEKKPFYHNGKVIGVWGTSMATSTLVGKNAQANYFDCRTNQMLKLTSRQKTCLWHLLQGKSAKEVAIDMGLSFRTVENHIYNIKLVNNIRSLRELLPHVRSIC